MTCQGPTTNCEGKMVDALAPLLSLELHAAGVISRNAGEATKRSGVALLPMQSITRLSGREKEETYMKTIRVYRLNTLSPMLFRHLKAAQMEAARVWNLCMQTHKTARVNHAPWPGQRELEQATKGRFALNAQAVQQIVHAFLANVETTRTLRREHPELARAYPWREKRFYPVKWPAQAVHREKGRVVLPMGKGHPSLVLAIALPENAGACTLVWNRGFELHVCLEVPQASEAPGSVQATVDLGEIHLAAVTTNTGKALIVTGRGIRSLKRQEKSAAWPTRQEAAPVPEALPALEEGAAHEEQRVQTGRTAYPRPATQGHSQSHRLLYQAPGRHTLHRHPTWRASPGLWPTSQGETAATLITSPTNRSKPASRARPAPNEAPAAGVPVRASSQAQGQNLGVPQVRLPWPS